MKKSNSCFKKLCSLVLTLVLVVSMLFMNSTRVSAYSIPKNMQWWEDSRFGMFIHFGSYSYYGQGEWAMSVQKIPKKEYQTSISANFNPVNFDASEIVNYAKNAGMKYLVITAKHHEGFSMWDTSVNSFKDYTGKTIYSLQKYTPFGSTGRDILMELKNACDAAGIKFCLYYSILDWNHSSQSGTNFPKISSMKARTNYIKDMKAQLKELITRYNPSILWFDGDWTYNSGSPNLTFWWTKKDGQNLYSYVKKLSPDIIINERVCRGFNLGDYDCPEQKVPDSALSRPWETNETMNGAWGYDSSKENSYKTTKNLIQELVTVVSRDGNFLLNIGPKGDGSITSGSQEILTGVGAWMKVYSDSIYGNSRSPFSKDPSWGTYTKKGNTVYAHVFNWPKNGILKSLSLSGSIRRVYLLDKPETSLNYGVKKGYVNITVPQTAPNENDSVVVIEYSSIKYKNKELKK